MSQLFVLSIGLAGIGLYVFPWNSPGQWFCAAYVCSLPFAIFLSWLSEACSNKKKHKK
jgi:hypothetical protein